MSVEFRVLGEVEVRVDGRRLEIGHARQCCVLAALLVDANRPVSVDQLVERVWAERPPHRARNALSAYVSRLRHSLHPADGVSIGRGSVGYTMVVAPDCVDLHLFHAKASRARATTDPASASEAFDEALALWRGEPFAGLETPWIADLRAALEVERFSIVLDRNDAALAAGRHAELLADMSVAITTHPLDERLAGQLMLAQYRCGRQGDALDTYRRMRDRLADELGIDPCPALRAVHQEILEGAAAAPTPTPTPTPVPVSPPPDRPRAPTTGGRRGNRFVGRTTELERIAASIRPGAVLTLTGVGGVGKTRLASESAHLIGKHYADGVCTCELAPLEPGATVGRAAAVALGLSRGHDTDFDSAVVEHLRSRRMLLVVDNCEHVLADVAPLVDRIVEECADVAVLATSREPLGIEGERLLPLDPLPEAEATELFAERARAIRPDFDLDTEPIGAVAEICRRLDGVPLAIELAAARLRVMSSLDVARRLDRLRVLSGGARGSHPRQQSVTATIDWSYRLLAQPERRLFDRASVFSGSFDLEAAHGVCADPGDLEDDTLESLSGLVDKSMVAVRSGTGTTRYALLETLRAFGRERLREAGAHDYIGSRHATYFIELAERGADAMHGPDEATWIARMAPTAGTTFTSPDNDNLRSAFERAMGQGDTALALRLVASLPELMHMRVGYTSMDWVERAIDAADPDQPAFAAAVGVAARGAWVCGDFPRALALARRAEGREPERGHSYLGYPADVVADVAVVQYDHGAALAYYRAAAEPARADATPSRLVWILYNTTVAHDVLDEPDAGIDVAAEALRVAEPTANPSTLAMARCAMGRALKTTDPVRALRFLQQGFELAEPVQNNWLTGIARMESAAIRAVDGDPHAAARMFLEVFGHWDQAGPGAGAQHWFGLRYAGRLLARLGAAADADAVLSTLRGPGAETGTDGALAGSRRLTGVEALALARAGLLRHSRPV
ncbi:AfsR/SARP family transcriptional regulator [Mycolicibacterium arabiense]|uniref:BTAD domain-containing putative transcriptional regulator n=1 Tax=Mycolicibacterium arabiense TaxID=1286181 RepID=UPI0013D00C85|nr:BTAD domain-containing putative transcriptional regulator [Mycolicibacterium arabiense]MCV7375160.1 AfsR/SARP family transcriptional regulator [Mycolicibacterium arabiense]